MAKTVPLMCAGFTVYMPMIRHSMNQPSKSLSVVIIGLGGLGHMDFKFGKAFWLKVTVFRRVNRRELKPLISSDNFVISFDEKQMEALKSSLHFIIGTVVGNHPFDPYLSLLKAGGILTMVGFPSELNVHPWRWRNQWDP